MHFLIVVVIDQLMFGLTVPPNLVVI